MDYQKCQVVLCVQENENIEILILKTKLGRDFWQNVTGHIEPFESAQEGAIREAMEETALLNQNIKKISELFSFTFTCDKRGEMHELVYLIQCHKKWDIQIDPSEHTEYKWVVPERAIKHIKYETNQIAIKKSLEQICRS